MSKILIFSGTGDGRMLAEKLAFAGNEVVVCVATEYGEQLMPENKNIKVHCGRMDEAHMHAFMSSCAMDVVVDATHPYAKIVSENIRRVCELKGYEYLRLVRDSFEDEIDYDNTIIVENTLEAAKFLNGVYGNIFISTGSKELSVFLENIKAKDRIYARVLPGVAILDEMTKAGLLGKQIICMQGPFSEELNYAMFIHTKARYLVTKESGSAGGFLEKIAAAKRANMKVVLIKRPQENGLSLHEILTKFNCNDISLEDEVTEKKITLCGIGMGSRENMTVEVRGCLSDADLIIGAGRMLDAVDNNNLARRLCLYKADLIADEIKNAAEMKIAVVLSGDVGFYSGAKKLLSELEKRGFSEKQINILPGISTAVYLASKLKIAWEDMKFVSLHGREQNVVDAVLHNEKVFALVGGCDGIAKLCKLLCECSLEEVDVCAASNLSYANEYIICKKAKELISYSQDGVSAAVIINKNAKKKSVTHGIADDMFIRDKVPMTKEEIRCISLAKLDLKEDSIVYDVGAGSGSVSIECAIRASKGKVYAIERKEEAVELIKKNCQKFAVSNVEVVKAYAPDIEKETDENMMRPTHAFIGGSGGNLKEILDWLYKKNQDIKIVVNAIALETVSELMAELKERKIESPEIVNVNVSKAKKLGDYNMMMANNPVYIFSF